jgi:hypothetical protein
MVNKIKYNLPKAKTDIFINKLAINVDKEELSYINFYRIYNLIDKSYLVVDALRRRDHIDENGLILDKYMISINPELIYQTKNDNKLVLLLTVTVKHRSKINTFNWNKLLQSICELYKNDIQTTDIFYINR